MGAGGRMSTSAEGQSAPKHVGGTPPRSPAEKPPFTLGDIKKAIPPHCFRRSILRSSAYLIQDLAAATALFYLAVSHLPHLPSPLRLLAWPLYWAVQGSVLMGVWVIGHECGHNAFSEYPLLDDAVGLLLHSALLTPYFSWKYSHRRHHANIASLDRDEAWVPKRRATVYWYSKYLNNNPFGRLFSIFFALTLGWPCYLVFNVYSRDYRRFASHFDPYSPIFTKSQRAQIFLSDAGFLGMGYFLYRLAGQYSLGWVMRVYGVPLVIMNGLLVMIVYLHHVHPSLPHYDASEWEWLRGALSTVDRDYGVLNTVLHNVTDTHVLHHLISTIPHYHAMEATEAIKPVLGKYYQFDGTPIWKAMWREGKECLFVEPDGEPKSSSGIFWYRNSYN